MLDLTQPFGDEREDLRFGALLGVFAGENDWQIIWPYFRGLTPQRAEELIDKIKREHRLTDDGRCIDNCH